MNWRYLTVLLLCLSLTGCARQNSSEEKTASDNAVSEEVTNDSADQEEKPEGMTVDEEAEFEVEEESGFSLE